ncbi:MAG: HIT family protein [Alphaproteobacteria bacterium]|nr:HIT family protein [Alphaproteobacteria bacterium]
MTNPTARKFGYPETLVAETGSWLVLVRPQQPTLGALVLVCKEPAEAFSGLSAAAFADLQTAIVKIERVLKDFTAYQRINYLMLMMVDKDVHFHVLPRYETPRSHGGASFADAGWPGPPALGQAVELSPADAAALAKTLGAAWAKA